MDSRLLNGKPKVTVIQRFDRSVIIMSREFNGIMEFNTIEDMRHFIDEQGYEINVAHIHPGQIEKD